MSYAQYYIKPSRRLLLAAAVLTTAVLAAGCNNSDYDNNRGLLGRNSADSFDEGAGRPPTPATLYAMARLMASQGHDHQAALILARINAEYPRFLPAYCDLAEAQLRHRQYDHAAETLRAGLKYAPGDPVLMNNLGMCLLLKGQTDEALQQFTQASAAAPQEGRYRTNIAMALGLLGRYDEAMSLYEQVIPNADAIHNLAVLSQVRGDTAAAERFAAKANKPSATLTEAAKPASSPEATSLLDPGARRQ